MSARPRSSLRNRQASPGRGKGGRPPAGRSEVDALRQELSEALAAATAAQRQQSQAAAQLASLQQQLEDADVAIVGFQVDVSREHRAQQQLEDELQEVEAACSREVVLEEQAWSEVASCIAETEETEQREQVLRRVVVEHRLRLEQMDMAFHEEAEQTQLRLQELEGEHEERRAWRQQLLQEERKLEQRFAGLEGQLKLQEQQQGRASTLGVLLARETLEEHSTGPGHEQAAAAAASLASAAAGLLDARR